MWWLEWKCTGIQTRKYYKAFWFWNDIGENFRPNSHNFSKISICYYICLYFRVLYWRNWIWVKDSEWVACCISSPGNKFFSHFCFRNFLPRLLKFESYNLITRTNPTKTKLTIIWKPVKLIILLKNINNKKK